MSKFEKFNIKSVEELKEKIETLGVNIELSDDFEPLKSL